MKHRRTSMTVYGEGKIRAYAAQAVEKLRGGG